MLYNSNDANFVLGCLLNNPNLLFNEKYKLSKKDFEPQLFHKVVFVCIYNLAIKKAKEIDEIAIYEWLTTYPSQLEIFNNNNGMDYIQTIKKISNLKTFNVYYDKLKVFSVLREYKDIGFDISEIFDETQPLEKEYIKLDQYTSESIVDYFEDKQSKVRKKFTVNSNMQETYVNDDNLEEFLDSLEEDPILGSGFPSLFLNSITRGWVCGHYTLFSAKTGFGKTTLATAMLTSVAISKFYSKKQGKYVDNPQYSPNNKGCYIHTEQTSHEIELRFLANVSKVPYGKIMDGNFTKEERDRIRQAKIILKESGLKIINYPDFTATGLREIYRNLSLEGYNYCVHDYIWLSGSLQSDVRKTMQLANTTETTSLIHLSNVLKQLSEEFFIGTLSMTQTNGKELTNSIIGADAIYGSRGIATKVETGFVAIPPSVKMLHSVSAYTSEYNKIRKRDVKDYLEPNIILNVYKGRYNRWGDGANMKIFGHLDRSTGTFTDMFCTYGEDDLFADVPKLIIKGNEISEN